ncbi:MAG: cellulose synthase operon protein YhjQ/BcsQ [Carbonactinosporaceae bacterium]
MSDQGNEPDDHDAPARSPLEEELARMGLVYGTSYIRPIREDSEPAGDISPTRTPERTRERPPEGWPEPDSASESERAPLGPVRPGPPPAGFDETIILNRETFLTDRGGDAASGESPPAGSERPPQPARPPLARGSAQPPTRGEARSPVREEPQVRAEEPLPSPAGHAPPAPQPAGYAPPPPQPAGFPTADPMTPVRQRERPPAAKWRRGVRAATAGVVRLGPSREEARQRDLEARVAAPIAGCYRIGVVGLKGGAGKTTIAACLGATFASLRGDRVIVVDGNPDRGTLGDRMPRESEHTVRDLLNSGRSITRYADVRAFTSRGAFGLEVLPSASDPRTSTALREADYRAVVDVLERYYSLVLTDCGTGLLHSAMSGVLGSADALVVVGSPSIDGARSTSATLDWLEAHGHQGLLRRSVAVVAPVLPQSPHVDVGKLAEHLAARCHAVARLPFDPHLATGPVIDLASLKAETTWSYLQIAAALADGFTSGR